MQRKIFVGIIAIVVMFIIICIVSGVTGCGNTFYKNYTKEELVNLIDTAQITKNHAHQMAESARVLGWKENDKLIKELQDRWAEADGKQKEYQQLLNQMIEEENAKWEQKAAEYPVATQIWRYMKAQGWNDYVCAGIMGNIMAEVGGQTLNIRYTLSSSGYYGMCQWSRGYSQVWGAGLETQCDFLRDTIKYEFDTYGFKYQKGFNFDSFLNMTNAKEAALAFAKSYERCASFTYGVRQKNAKIAYDYFVN